ncbi:hypothetical protein V1509DRAFT_642030 [Lipomyces kononenkoae]
MSERFHNPRVLSDNHDLELIYYINQYPALNSNLLLSTVALLVPILSRSPSYWKNSVFLFHREEVPLTEVKKPAYEAMNPNGRLPAIKDPNSGITIWETGAIFRVPHPRV